MDLEGNSGKFSCCAKSLKLWPLVQSEIGFLMIFNFLNSPLGGAINRKKLIFYMAPSCAPKNFNTTRKAASNGIRLP